MSHSSRVRSAAILVAALGSLATAGAQAPPDPIAAAARIEAAQTPNRQGWDGFTLDELMARLHVPGVSIAVIHDFTVHWTKGYGTADVETRAPVTPATLFQAASISKPVAAVATLKTVEAGRFGLDDNINDVLKTWKVPGGEHTRGRPVTPRTLLSHSSGLGDGFGFPGYAPGVERPTVLQILQGSPRSNVGPVFMERAPLVAFKYSGGGTLVMQQALMDALGRPFEDIARDLVLAPLGMTNSAYDQPPTGERERRTARAHNGRGQAMDAKWHVYPELAAAGLWTTPGDLATFAIAVQRALRGDPNLPLSRTMAREMVDPVGVGDYGAGLHVSKRGEGWYFGHGGSNWGFRCQLLAHKVKGYGVVVMTNSDSGSILADEVIARVAATYAWDLLDKPVPR